VAATARSDGAVAAAAPLDSSDFSAEIALAQDQKQRLAHRMQQMQQLSADGAATEGELNSARTQYDQASAKLEELYRTMALQTRPPPHSGGGGNSSSVAVQTRILAIQTELSNLDTQLEAMTVRAPKSGRIVDLSVVKGDQLAIGSKVAMLAPEGGEMHIDAYIPPKHAIYAAPGMYAAVIFPDGTRRRAVVADVPQVATEVPKAQSALLGEAELGVVVRMQFVDGVNDAQRPLTDGLPVKVEFDNGWDMQGTHRFVVQLQHYLGSLKERLSDHARA
jgi:multidrug resistance efflux pump